jgi:hypothetical protein
MPKHIILRYVDRHCELGLHPGVLVGSQQHSALLATWPKLEAQPAKQLVVVLFMLGVQSHPTPVPDITKQACPTSESGPNKQLASPVVPGLVKHALILGFPVGHVLLQTQSSEHQTFGFITH